MNIRIACSCGTSYEFEVEPADGRMPTPVQCPHCGVDGTDAANTYISQASAEPASPLTAQPRLSLNRQPAHSQGAPVSATLRSPACAGRRPPLVRGILGAIVGGLVGMFGWYLFIKATGYEFGWIAWAVGVVTGVGARVMARSGSDALGFIAAGCALVAILGGEYLALESQVNVLIEQKANEMYDAELAYAKEAVQADDDEKARVLLAKRSEETARIEASQITAAQLADFRQEEQPRMKRLIDGQPTRADCVLKLSRGFRAFVSPWTVFKESLGLSTLLWVFLGVGSALKIGARIDTSIAQ